MPEIIDAARRRGVVAGLSSSYSQRRNHVCVAWNKGGDWGGHAGAAI